MKYRELADNPKDGVYQVVNTNTFVAVEGNKIAHSPSGATIDDEAEVVEV